MILLNDQGWVVYIIINTTSNRWLNLEISIPIIILITYNNIYIYEDSSS
jgi:hypothetical protein